MTQYERRGRRGTRDVLYLIGLLVVLLLALLGLVSAGVWAGQNLFVSGNSRTHSHLGASASPAGTATVARAQATAAAIVAAARRQSRRIVVTAREQARVEATAVVRQARRVAAATGPPAAPAPTSPPPLPAPTAPLGVPGPPGQAGVSPAPTALSGAASNLTGLPQSWLVVAYDATFGSGPGSAGGITVTNRSSKAFSGTARVTYLGSGRTLGSAQASFAGLAPGQTVILPLNGPEYPSGASGYRISVLGVH